nr:hypothetical protein BgiMline_021586 [Biomphalaria glabrata]
MTGIMTGTERRARFKNILPCVVSDNVSGLGGVMGAREEGFLGAKMRGHRSRGAAKFNSAHVTGGGCAIKKFHPYVNER